MPLHAQKGDSPLFLGMHLVDVVLRHGRSPVAELVVVRGGSSKGLARTVTLAQEKHVAVKWVTREEMAAFTGGEPSDVAAALAERATFAPDDVMAAEGCALALVIEGVEDPHNLGDILRTAWAAGVDVAVLERHAEGLRRDQLARHSAGASECLPLVFVDDLVDALGALSAMAVHAIAADAKAPDSIFSAELPERLALVVGGEHRGISRHVLDACTRRVSIPTANAVQSLSAVSSAAALLFEVVRRRGV